MSGRSYWESFARPDAQPDWLEPLYAAERMRAIDRWAIEERGAPSLELMEQAGAGLAACAAPCSARATAAPPPTTSTS